MKQDTRRGQNNADGFGIGFYTDPKLGSAPCLFTSTTPAWNCTNLQLYVLRFPCQVGTLVLLLANKVGAIARIRQAL